MKLDGTKIKNGRKALSIPMTAGDLAKAVGLSARMINMIEAGKSTKRKTAERIAKAVKIPLEDLIKREAA